MLGYTEEDLNSMKFALSMASFYLPPSQDDVAERLKVIHDFIEGLIQEGYVNV